MPWIQQGNPQNLSRKRSLRSEMTTAERRLWSRLRAKQFFGLKFRRQHVGPYIVDFYCSERLTVIEVDGDVHGQELRKRKDEHREKNLKNPGLHIIRYTNDEILKDLDGVLEDLKMDWACDLPPLAPPIKEGDRAREDRERTLSVRSADACFGFRYSNFCCNPWLTAPSVILD